jgi:hypothetical protein
VPYNPQRLLQKPIFARTPHSHRLHARISTPHERLLITVLFLAALALSVSIRLWLSFRQSAHVSAHRNAVPADFSAQIELAAHQKAADYTLAKGRYGRIDLALASSGCC